MDGGYAGKSGVGEEVLGLGIGYLRTCSTLFPLGINCRWTLRVPSREREREREGLLGAC